jgi:imidazolonepropionase-like amidohydrolase
VEELDLLSAAGLGREGALVAATEGAATMAGLVGRVDVSIRAGARTVLVVLDTDPVQDPTTWARPIAVVAAGRVVAGTAAAPGSAR